MPAIPAHDPLALTWDGGTGGRGAQPLNVFDGGTNYLFLLAANSTTPVAPPNGALAWALGYLINTGAAQSVTVSLYDLQPGDTPGSGNLVFGPITLGANAVVKVPIKLKKGTFAIVASSAVGAPVMVTFWD